MKCTTCRQEYSIQCDYNQGRCPNHKPMINFHSMRFLNLFTTIKEWFSRDRNNSR
jgi:hypothetical protein